jgi:Coenzyme PQQ synthesis protein D (PqqD)
MPVEKSSTTVYTPLDDGTGVLLNVETLFYFSLNRTGAALWQELEANNPSTLDDLTRVLCERFDVERDAARREIDDFVKQLERLKMVRIV